MCSFGMIGWQEIIPQIEPGISHVPVTHKTTIALTKETDWLV